MMENIKVSHGELGSIVAKPINNISKKKKFMIKSLAFLQLVCMTPDNEEDENFGQFLDIVSKAAADARALYKEGTNESSSIKQF